MGARVPYFRLTRDAWIDRIHAAKAAGFNTIETPVIWSRHEPRQGRFDFTGENDLRYFVDLIGKAGMYCVLGVGPYVNAGYDMGGLPPWLIDPCQGRLRTVGGAFLEATSKYFTALADQIRGWQVTAPGSGGPIVMLQCEDEWTCANEDLAASYLGEINRYLRESGLTVPLINDNQLWASVEGQIDGWSDTENSLEQMRQLSVVRPEQPRIVLNLLSYEPDTWGHPSAPPVAPWAALRRAAEVLAGGGQFIIQSFCAGTNFGFSSGRTANDPHSFVASASDVQSLLSESGTHQNSYSSIRRIATFAARFGRVFATMDSDYRPISLAPQSAAALDVVRNKALPKVKGESAALGTAIIHGKGPQGGVVFCFGDEPQTSNPKIQNINLILGDGWTLPVTLPKEGVAWCLFDVKIGGRSKLDYCNVCALGTVGQVLVCFGVAGSRAMFSVEGSPVEVTIAADKPVIIEHESLTLVIVPQEMTDQVFLREDAVHIGHITIATDGSVLPLPGTKGYITIKASGEQLAVAFDGPTKHRTPPVPQLTSWSHCSVEEYIGGGSDRYATISGPAELTKLGVPSGYGWYRLTINATGARKIRSLLPFGRDRLHVFASGAHIAIVGVGMGAVNDIMLPLKKGEQHIVVLADNLGRFSEGANIGENKGLYGDIFAVGPVKAPAPKIMPGKTIEAMAFRSPLWEVRSGEATLPDRLSWVINHKRPSSLIIRFPKTASSGIIMVNDQPLAYTDSSGPTTFVVEPDQMEDGTLLIQVAIVNSVDPNEEFAAISQAGIEIFEAIEAISESADVAFAKWEYPIGGAFTAAQRKETGPVWWRSAFTVEKAHPMYLDLAGLTKGQLYVNDRHLCRYWVSTPAGEPVGPQTRYFVPPSWLRVGSENDVTIFDEHGASPTKIKFVV